VNVPIVSAESLSPLRPRYRYSIVSSSYKQRCPAAPPLSIDIEKMWSIIQCP
jgi:hypothetical protein